MNRIRHIRTVFRLALSATLIGVMGCVGTAEHGRDASPATAAATCHGLPAMATSTAPTYASDGNSTPNTAPAPHADRLMRDGAAAYSAGEFGPAARDWEKAAGEYAGAGRAGERCDALLDLAAAEQSLGSFKEAAEALNTALPLARGLHDRRREIALLNSLGVVYTFTRNDKPANDALSNGLKLAEAAQDTHAAVKLLNNMGNLAAMRGDYVAASKSYEEAATHAEAIGDSLTQARGLTNQSLALSRGQHFGDAIPIARHARELTASLKPSHEKADLLLTQGRIFWAAHLADPNDPALADEALSNYAKAAEVAGTIGDRTLLSFAFGFQGEIAEAQKQNDASLALTRRALFLAQETESTEALYRWQWQIGRVLRDQGNIAGAIDEYDAAIRTLQKIHGDLANGYGNQAGGGSFRESVGPIYSQMADLLLRQADAAADAHEVQRLLLQARDTVELLKSDELDDYFHQKCVSILGRKIEQEAKTGAAVVYLIPLPDRTEMLLSTAAGMTRFKSPVGSEELTREVREFRERLEDRTSNRYLLNARKLYNWIIRPIEPKLAAEKIDTLIFVPDGALRTIPMAALNDGKEFLISKYAVAITPGLTLMMGPADKSAEPGNDSAPRNVLEGGLSVSSVKGFAPLEYVPQELGDVHRLFPDGAQLLNQTFTAENFRAEMNQQDFSFVHLASHAEFSHNENDTFLLTYDRKMSLDDLSRLIERHRYAQQQPLELLALSACQTAAGDDRAALGLAGVAIRMGARTAVATLWSVNDEASAELIQQFYTSLRNDPKLSKAKAMQRAQKALLQDVRYRHPCYWAPYLVIGNWL